MNEYNKPSSTILVSQTSQTYRFTFPTIYPRCIGFRVTNLNLNDLTSTGRLLWLTCNQAVQPTDQLSRLSTGVPSTVVWNQPYPLPTHTNQLESREFWFEQPRYFDYLDFQLQSDGVLTFGGTFYADWEVILYFQNC